MTSKARKHIETLRRRGRPELPTHKRRGPVCASVTPAEARKITGIGRGSFSAGVHRMLEWWKETR